MRNRKIDAAIALHVMGWTHADDGFWIPPALNDHYNVAVPHYSTDPAASRLLRDKLAEQKWGWRLEKSRYFGRITFCLDQGNAVLHEARADTEELAVAICALKSVGVEIPE